jgi:hypothetical protein
MDKRMLKSALISCYRLGLSRTIKAWKDFYSDYKILKEQKIINEGGGGGALYLVKNIQCLQINI